MSQTSPLTRLEIPSRFPLMRYFAIVSLVVIVLLIAGAGLITLQEVRNELIARGEEYAISVAQHLNQDLHHRFGSPLDLHTLMLHPEEAKQLEEDLYGLAVERVKLYDAQGIIVYSDVAALIGTDDRENLLVRDALAGQMSSEFIQAQQQVDVAGEPDLVIDVLETYVPLYDLTGSNRIIGVVEVYQDVSGIHQQVRQLQGGVVVAAALTMALLFLSLLGLVWRADRIIDHQFSALQQANTDLIALQQAKDRLTHMVVHDLKNPLTSVQGFLQLLLLEDTQPALSEQQIQFVEQAQRGGERLLTMIQDLLDIAKLEEGQLSPQIESLSLADAVAEAMIGPDSIAEGRGLSLTASLPDDLPPVLADRALLRRVLDNLLSNALKYAETTIHISATTHAESGHVQIAIGDDGRGIPPELREAIFDRFTQVQAADARTGTGLGLTFCKLAVEAHGGRIWVEDHEGAGSRFVFTIPGHTGGEMAADATNGS